MPAAHDITETDLDLVERWRAQELARAGFDVEAALELASLPEVDLHDAISLVRSGCPPELAIRILR
jgi:hypothetical protein